MANLITQSSIRQHISECIDFDTILLHSNLWRNLSDKVSRETILVQHYVRQYENHDKNCEVNGMETAILRSPEELDFILRYMNNNSIDWVGMGMKCVNGRFIWNKCTNGRFIWNDGRDVTFGKWCVPNSCTDDQRVWIPNAGYISDFRIALKNDSNYTLCTEVTTQERFLRIVSLIKNNSDTLSDTKIQMLESIANYSLSLQNEISTAMKSMNDRIANISTNNLDEGKNSPICNHRCSEMKYKT